MNGEKLVEALSELYGMDHMELLSSKDWAGLG